MCIGDMNLFIQIGDIWFSWQFTIQWSELNPISVVVSAIVVVTAIFVIVIINIAIINNCIVW